MMPVQRPHRSKQDYGTPPEFIHAVLDMLGVREFGVDLAASADNTVAYTYIDENQNSLASTVSWARLNDLWMWLNPPFSNIRPWVEKAYAEAQRGAKIAVLVPASVGSNWWRDWVDGKAKVLVLNGRITFVGHDDPYPKDCALLLYRQGVSHVGYGVWSWKNKLMQY